MSKNLIFLSDGTGAPNAMRICWKVFLSTMPAAIAMRQVGSRCTSASTAVDGGSSCRSSPRVMIVWDAPCLRLSIIGDLLRVHPGAGFPEFAEVPIVSNRATAAMARAWIDPTVAMATVPSGMLGRVQMPAR